MAVTMVVVGFPYVTWRVISFQAQGSRFTGCDYHNHLVQYHQLEEDLQKCE